MDTRREREVEVAVVSDLHLGTAAARVAELDDYLAGIRPRVLVLNGDVFDLWHFKSSRWCARHEAIVARVIALAAQGTAVHYLVGNHDEALRPWVGRSFAGVRLDERLELEVGGERLLFCHGDAFDDGRCARSWLSWVGDKFYDGCSALDRQVARGFRALGWRPRSVVGWSKDRLPQATRYIAAYERRCLAGAAAQGFDGVVCGHIHRARLHAEVVADRVVSYRNSGDWVDSMTALEYGVNGWRIVALAGIGVGVMEADLVAATA